MALSGCQNSDGPGLLTPETPLSRSDFLLNTFVTITLYDSDDSSILDDSMALCKEYENIFSKTLETSELYQINHRTTDTVTVSDDMAALLSKGLEYCEKSGRRFRHYDRTAELPLELHEWRGCDPGCGGH